MNDLPSLQECAQAQLPTLMELGILPPRDAADLPARYGPGDKYDQFMQPRNLMTWDPVDKLLGEAEAAGQSDIATRGGQHSPWAAFCRSAEWLHFSVSTGSTPGRRVNRQNNARLLHGLCGTYTDHTLSFADDGSAVVKRLLNLDREMRPQLSARRLDGGCMVLWLLKRPLLLNEGACSGSEVLAALAAALRLPDLFPMFDAKATCNPGHLHAAPVRWVDVVSRLSRNGFAETGDLHLVEAFVASVVASMKYEETAPRGRCEMTDIAQAVQEAYPAIPKEQIGRAHV